MKKRIKILVLTILLGIVVSYAGFAGGKTEPKLWDIQKVLTKTTDEVALALPFTSSFGLNWSDAYIGKQEKGVPFVFGAGLALGVTTLPVGAMNDLLDELGFEKLDIGRFPLPVYAAEGRLGGFSLPFDFGLKISFLPPINVSILDDTKINYLLVGGDLRYALMQGNNILPKISIGAGFNYFKGGTISRSDLSQDIYYSSSEYVQASDPRDVSFKFDTLTLDFKTQVSKSFSSVTPYLGLGISHGWTKVGYSVDSSMKKSDDSPIGGNEIATFGNYGVKLSPNKMSSSVENTGMSFRAFGGISLDTRFLNVDLTGLYNFRDGNFGVSLGFKYQSSNSQRPVRQQNVSSNEARIVTGDAAMAQTSVTSVLTGYFVGINGQQVGPFDTAGLRQLISNGQLTRDSLVWKEGMANWVAAATITELAPLFF